MATMTLGGKCGSGTVNDVWVAVEPSGRQCHWKGENKFRVICCTKAFSPNSSCKFAFCPQCAMDFREKLNSEGGNTTGGRARSSKRTKAVSPVAGADCPTGNNHKEGGGGGGCGKHTLKELLTLSHEQSNKTYLKCKRDHVTGVENIVEHCVGCGIRF